MWDFFITDHLIYISSDIFTFDPGTSQSEENEFKKVINAINAQIDKKEQ